MTARTDPQDYYDRDLRELHRWEQQVTAYISLNHWPVRPSPEPRRWHVRCSEHGELHAELCDFSTATSFQEQARRLRLTVIRRHSRRHRGVFRLLTHSGKLLPGAQATATDGSKPCQTTPTSPTR